MRHDSCHSPPLVVVQGTAVKEYLHLISISNIDPLNNEGDLI
jgi:hypothetical protein